MAKKDEQPRMTFDVVLVQAHLSYAENYTLRELAQHVFEKTTPVCVARISQALRHLHRMGRVSLTRAGYNITEVRAICNPIAQVDACFFLMVYKAIHSLEHTE